jgi:hypothetical protein
LPFVAGDEYGIGSSHWRQTISTGNGVTVNYYDAQCPPLVTRTYDSVDAANTGKFVVRRYASAATCCSSPTRSARSRPFTTTPMADTRAGKYFCSLTIEDVGDVF